METFVLKGGLFDGTEYFEDSVVLIDSENGVISQVGRANEVDVPKDAKVLGDAGHTIIPGMIDAHVHFFGTPEYDLLSWVMVPEPLVVLRTVPQLKSLLRAGFTAVREMGSKGGAYISAAVRDGTIDGPTVLSCAKSLGQTGGDDDPINLPLDIAQKLSYSYFGDGPWEIRKAVRKCVRDGADFIKVYAATGSTPHSFRSEDYRIRPQLTVEELKPIVDEAHRIGIKVACHTIGEVSIENAIEAGVDSLEHGMALTEETAATIKKKGIYYVPTLGIFLTNLTLASMIEGGTDSKDPVYVRRHFKKDMELAKKYELDVVCGTDFGGTSAQPHGKNYVEVAAIAKYFGNKEALISATSRAAKSSDLKHVGQIKQGMEADLVLVRGNPMNDIEVLAPQNIQAVFKRGRNFGQ
jgi:imidazolonepropionase-like amidohydrolase